MSMEFSIDQSMQKVLDSLQKAFILLGKDRRVAHVNAAAIAWCGLHEDKIAGMKCDEFFSKCFAGSSILSPVEEVFKDAKPRHQRSKVDEEVVDLFLSPVVGDTGEVELVSIVMEYSTDQVKVEDLLSRNAEGLTVLYELSSAFMGSSTVPEALNISLKMIKDYYDADLVSVAVPAGLDVELEFIAGVGWQEDIEGIRFAVDDDDLAGYSMINRCPAVVTDFDSEQALKCTELMKQNGIKSGISVPMIVKDRALGVLCVLYKKPRAIDTAELWYLNVVTNTLAVYIEKERTVERLAESEAFLSSVLNGIGEGVVVINRQYRIISANKGYVDSLKLNQADVIGQYCHKVAHHSVSPCFEHGEDCSVKKVFDTGDAHASLHTHYTKDKGYINVQINAYPIRNADGEIVAAVETGLDVTDKVRLEKDVEKRVHELEEFYEMAVGRELRMIELKDEVQRLQEELDRIKGQ
jgi:PAS domain S-box-containing protein